ncbi:MAG TPA: hypothetical protein VEJ87_06315 [Acidimicrobiales bacterium]|nr:hypothetical protein [Acidimicrobiales bacterium]
MKPLAASDTRRLDGVGNKFLAYSSMLLIRRDNSVQQERVACTVPGHVGEANQRIWYSPCHPTETVRIHLEAPCVSSRPLLKGSRVKLRKLLISERAAPHVINKLRLFHTAEYLAFDRV